MMVRLERIRRMVAAQLFEKFGRAFHQLDGNQ
jgi:hypothetical protein